MNEAARVATLRAKMLVSTVKSSVDHNGQKTSEEISLNAVYSNDSGSANSQWSKWTPSASLNLQVNNPVAFGKVLPGQFFFVDLIPTDKDSL